MQHNPNNHLLTIGIPTYNGEKYIKDTLDSVFSQINHNLAEKVDVLVSDNASIDNTAHIVANYIAKHGDIVQYVKNPTNMGFDWNLNNLFTHARGKYVWLMGDDDALYDGH